MTRRRKRRWLLAVMGGSVGLLGVMTGIAADRAAAQTSAGVRLESTAAGNEVRVQLAPRHYTILASEIGAKVNRLLVAEGGRFAKGDALILLDCAVHEAQLRKAEAAFAAADNNWQANRRLVDLNAIGKVELEILRGEVGKARAEVSAMAAMVSKCRIEAPFAGRVAEQKIREQQYVQAGQALLDILDDSTLEAEFLVPSRWLAWIRSSQKLTIRIDETDREYPASVQRIGARVDPVSLSIKINATIDGEFPELLAGMSGVARLTPEP
jgi:membrane fusion protein (multidrug efflux system)